MDLNSFTQPSQSQAEAIYQDGVDRANATGVYSMYSQIANNPATPWVLGAAGLLAAWWLYRKYIA